MKIITKLIKEKIGGVRIHTEIFRHKKETLNCDTVIDEKRKDTSFYLESVIKEHSRRVESEIFKKVIDLLN